MSLFNAIVVIPLSPLSPSGFPLSHLNCILQNIYMNK